MEDQQPDVYKVSNVVYQWRDIEFVTVPASRSPLIVSSTYTMLLITSGSGIFLKNKVRERVISGDCVILPPGEAIVIKVGDEALTYYRIGFEVFGSINSESVVTGQPLLDKLLQQAIISCESFSSCLLLAEELYKQHMLIDELEQMENQLRFQKLLLYILKQFRSTNRDTHLRKDIQDSIEYINNNFHESISIEELAMMTSTNRSSYTQLFKEITGQLPIDYLNTLRIDKAQQLLLMTEDNLQQIAQTIGYSTEYYFNRKFKNKVGLTPGKYRSGYKANSNIFAPFLEDFLIALDVKPVLQCSHKQWGQQEYLNMSEVPTFDVTAENWSILSEYDTEFIILSEGYERWSLQQCSQISPVYKLFSSAENWRETLQTIGTIVGRKDKVAIVIDEHEQNIAQARAQLSQTLGNESVAVLRIASNRIHLYGGPTRGYTGPLLYQNLGLAQPAMVQRISPDERRVNLSMDALSKLDADHIFITFEKEDEVGAGRELLQSSIWQALPAVKGNRVYEVDFYAWMNYGVLSHNRKIEDILRVLA